MTENEFSNVDVVLAVDCYWDRAAVISDPNPAILLDVYFYLGHLLVSLEVVSCIH